MSGVTQEDKKTERKLSVSFKYLDVFFSYFFYLDGMHEMSSIQKYVVHLGTYSSDKKPLHYSTFLF